MLLLQAPRFAVAMGKESQRLDDLASRGEDFLNGLVQSYLADTEIITITLTDRQFFCVPQVGFYTFWLRDPDCLTEYTLAFALPVHPQVSIAVVSKTFDKSYLEFLIKQDNFFAGASVGMSENSAKVVIPRGLVEKNDENRIKEALKTFRRLQKEQNDAVLKIRSLVKEMYEMTGFQLEYSGPLSKKVRMVESILVPHQTLEKG